MTNEQLLENMVESIIKKEPGYIPKKTIIPRAWQREVLNLLEKNNDKNIYWIYDKIGNTGKTSICDYIIENYSNVQYFDDAKRSDVYKQIVKSGFTPNICLFDLSKECMKLLHYDAIAQCKAGVIYSSKNQTISINLYFEPKVIVFSNNMPKFNLFNLEYWKIYTIKDNVLEKVEV